MEYEWDENKRLEVLRERGVDFRRAVLIFNAPSPKKVPDLRHDYGEPRWQAIGRVDDETLMVVYTPRGNVTRIITA
jgi:uncharacterized DUF497 family protein